MMVYFRSLLFPFILGVYLLLPTPAGAKTDDCDRAARIQEQAFEIASRKPADAEKMLKKLSLYALKAQHSLLTSQWYSTDRIS